MAKKRHLARWPNRPLQIARSLERAAAQLVAAGAAEPPTPPTSDEAERWKAGGLALVPTPRGVAFHEAGHAIMAAAFGVEVEFAKIVGVPAVRFGGVLSEYAHLLILHAGPIAERLADRITYRPTDDELTPWIDAARNRWAAGHDYSKIFAHSLRVHPDWNTETRLVHFRQYEAMTIELLSRRPFRAALAEVADALLAHGTIGGDVVAEIVGKYISDSDLDVEP